MTGSTVPTVSTNARGELQNDLRLSLQVLLVIGGFITLALMLVLSVNALPGLIS